VSTDTTRERVLSLIVSAGPITAAALAESLGLTPAAVRRHLGTLGDDHLIAEHDVVTLVERGRGRPARSYVATRDGQQALQSAYGDVARSAIAFMRERGGLDEFIQAQQRQLEHDLSVAVDPDAALPQRVEALSEALAEMGYATSVRPGPGGFTLQLCQGHCPVQEVAQAAPEWCDAEARAFSRVLDVHVQRLSTLARGAHVCTTTIPLTPAIKEG